MRITKLSVEKASNAEGRRPPARTASLVWLASCLILVALIASPGAPGPAALHPFHASSGRMPRFVRHVSAEEIQAALATMVEPGESGAIAPAGKERAALKALYAPSPLSPMWLDAKGRPSADAQQALELLGAAADEGLDPRDYEQAQLLELARRLSAPTPVGPSDLARFDVTLSAAMLRYFRHLHLGRVDPRTIGFRLVVPVDQHDFPAMLRAAVERHRIRAAAAELRPPFAQYGALRTMLGRYRSLATDRAVQLPPASPVAIRPGQPYEGARALTRLLTAFGDLPAGASFLDDSQRYDGPLAVAVKRFQTRHGLDPDGVIGQGTLAALRTPLAWRVRQIEFALERLRWLPDLKDQRLLVVNIPMFRLWAWDSVPPTAPPALGMGVIVGRALSTQTPVFVESMEEVIFRPYWNVPPSILRHEIVPKLIRDPGYLRQQNMEIVGESGSTPIEPTPNAIAQLRAGTLRVRQRPGPQNSLGLVKFVFPNEENVYMHGTPARELFARSRRDFSHGCVRVEDPVGLAVWALRGQPEWPRDRIEAALTGMQTIEVKLTRPIQVILFYTTATVVPEDGSIWFADDIYHHDERLERILSESQTHARQVG